MKKDNRHYDLDWIRVLATLAVFLYHCSMFFNPFPWHVKNNQLDSGGILAFSLFAGSWLMPIFIAVSGISVMYTLQKRTTKVYIRERLVRLGVPLLFGVVFLTPPQVYIERITHNQFNGSFVDFLPHYFDGLYLSIGGTGNFAFFGLHLWYLLVLLVFSFLTLPLFKTIGRKDKFGPIHFILLPILLFLVGVIKTVNLGGWDLVFYLAIFIYGYYFLSNEAFKPVLQKTIKIHFSIAMITSIVFIVWFMKAIPQPGTISDVIFYAVHSLNCWSWLLCIFFLADRYLSFSNRFLKYGSEASMPFYVLHQPVIVLFGYLINDLSWPMHVKLIFLVSASFMVIMLCYQFVIKRIRVLRFLFGMKGSAIVKKSVTVTTTASR
ncbi:acyltransferase family protein [Paenibacillus sp. BSR1-1]|uniref:acyltransferase family protein n=1 Tax=Paenibacillus sp. BSR1-1 TaxID=3020845 RepID=UPI0025B03169|nr:acyltransferase family protein [Paenibacillus sp. BSR1-1]MDN3017384.1 acyltransferase family protein [Paenibacillus sp. BSR1-1]